MNFRIGVAIPNSGGPAMNIGIPELGHRAEQAGFDSLWTADHIVFPAHISSRYPFSTDGLATWPTDIPWFDVIVAMSMLAAATSTVEIGTAAMVLPLRHPIITAKQLASLDAASGGRLVLGVGAGWLAEEFEALSVPFASRGSRLDEWITLLRGCWTGAPQSHNGRHYQLPDNVLSYPTPARHVPILVAGHSPAALRRAAGNDGWLPIARAADLDPIDLGEQIDRIHALRESNGNLADPRVVLRIIESADAVREIEAQLPALIDAGVTDIAVEVNWDSASDIQQTHDILRAAAS